MKYFLNDRNIFLMTVLVGMILFVGFMPTNHLHPEGIYPIGDGEGLVLCGESITLNAHAGIREGDLYDMFDEALTTLENNCN